MQARFLVSGLLALAFAVGPLAQASDERSSGDDSFFGQRGIDDRAAFFIGGINSRTDTTAQIDSQSGIGTTLLLERLFALPRERDYPRFQAYYRFSRKHRLDFRYLRVSSAGTNTLFEDEIVVGPLTFQLGASIGASQKTRFGAIEYRYAFVNDGRAEAGISAGLGVVDLDLEIFGEAGITPGPIVMASERVNETVLLPVLGVYTDFTLTRRLFLSVEGLLFTTNYSKYSGDVSDVRAPCAGARRSSSVLVWHSTARESTSKSNAAVGMSASTMSSRAPRCSSRSLYRV